MRFDSRLALVSVAALTLSACEVNRVRSYAPLFHRRDVADVTFRGGLWASEAQDCAFDPASSVKTWPDCAGGVKARGDEFNRTVRGQGFTVENRLAHGEPMILQSRIETGQDIKEPRYEYAAIQPVRRDTEGRIVAYAMWSVLCGKPEEPPADVEGSPTAAVPGPEMPIAAVDDLPAGITRDAGRGCIARDADAVRGAAALTRDRGWKAPAVMYWVRPTRFRDNFGGPPKQYRETTDVAPAGHSR